jgi:hypothetical protein
MQHPPTFLQPLEVLESKHRPIKRQKVSGKAKKADENLLSAAAIVAPISQSTNKDAVNNDLSAVVTLVCSCGADFNQQFNLNKHQKKCGVHEVHLKLSDLAN